MFFKIILVIVIIFSILLILSGSIPSLSMLSPISNVILSTFKVIFSILRGVWPIVLIALCGYYLVKSRK